MSFPFDFDNGSYPPKGAGLTDKQRALLEHILQGGSSPPSHAGADPEDPQKIIETQLVNLAHDLRDHNGSAAIDVAMLDKYWPGVGAVYAAARGAART
jgi:hypothetical protein